MKRYQGNEKVDPGIYFNLAELTFKSVEETDRLPGEPEDVWRRVPALVLLVAAPIIGLVYVMFLPLVGFLMLGGLLMEWMGKHLVAAIEALVRVLRPAWQPATAFLGRGKAAKKQDDAAADAWADEVRDELDDED